MTQFTASTSILFTALVVAGAGCGSSESASADQQSLDQIPLDSITMERGPVDPASIAFVANRTQVDAHPGVSFDEATLLGEPAFVRIQSIEGGFTLDLIAKWEMYDSREFVEVTPGVFEGQTCFVDQQDSEPWEDKRSCIERLFIEDSNFHYGDRVAFEGVEYRTDDEMQASSGLSGNFVVAPDTFAPEGRMKVFSKYNKASAPILPWQAVAISFSEPIDVTEVEQNLQGAVGLSIDVETALPATVYASSDAWWPAGQTLSLTMPQFADYAGNEGAVDPTTFEVADLPPRRIGRVELDGEDDAVVLSDAHYSFSGGALTLTDCVGSTTNDEGQNEATLANYDVLFGLKGTQAFSKILVQMDIEGGFDTPTANFLFAEEGDVPRSVEGQRMESGDEVVYEIQLEAPVEAGYLQYSQTHPGAGAEFCPSQSTTIGWVEVQ